MARRIVMGPSTFQLVAVDHERACAAEDTAVHDDLRPSSEASWIRSLAACCSTRFQMRPSAVAMAP